jgi:hypothetical protein
MATVLAIEIGKSAKLYRVTGDTLVKIAEAYIQVHLYPQIIEFENPVLFVPYIDALPNVNMLINSGVKVYSLSDKFSYHDAAMAANPYSGVTVIDGMGTNSESLSVYVNQEIRLRAFGLNKSLSTYLSNCSEVSESVNVPLSKSKLVVSAEQYIEKEAAALLKEIISINLLTVDYDMLTNYGATVAFNMHCHRVVDYQKRKYGRLLAKEIVELTLNKLLETLRTLYLLYSTDTKIQVIGPLFDQLPVIEGCIYGKVNPVFGMIKQVTTLEQ